MNKKLFRDYKDLKYEGVMVEKLKNVFKQDKKEEEKEEEVKK